jgi:hypothetical protein
MQATQARAIPATAPVEERLAGAPISWGACEVPGWGVMPVPAAVLGEMAELGLRGTELGPPGFLPDDPVALAGLRERHGLALVGGFAPLVLYEPVVEAALAEAERLARLISGAGGTMLVLAAVHDVDWSAPQDLDEPGWRRLAEHLNAIESLASRYGLSVALHPHAGTLIETAEQVRRALEVVEVGWCLDTGHLLISRRWARATPGSPRSWTPCKRTGTADGSCSSRTPPSPETSRRWPAGQCATLARASPSFTNGLGRRRRSTDETTAPQYRHHRLRGCCRPARGGVRQQREQELE